MPLHDLDEIPWKETRAIRSNRDLMREIRAGLTALRARASASTKKPCGNSSGKGNEPGWVSIAA